MINTQEKSYNKIYFLALLLVGLILIIPLIDVRFMPGHDSVFHILRIESVAASLKEGIWPVRIYVNSIQYWGAPVGIFYPSLFIYIPALLKNAGVPIEICYNIYIAIIIYLGLLASWFGFSLLTKSKLVGFLSAILYISSGYYLLTAYIRHALGELTALSFMPCAIACLICLIRKTKVPVKIYIISIISVSAIIESHILSSIFLAVFSLVFMIIKIKKISFTVIKRIVFISFITFILNASFLIPFLMYYTTIPLSTIHYIEDFPRSGLEVITLLRFSVFWNFWLFVSSPFFLLKDYISATTNYKHKQFFYYFSCFVTGLLFLVVSSEPFPWNALSPLDNIFKYMQFSWRFLGFSTLFFCVCGGFGLYLMLKIHKTRFSKKLHKFAYVGISILICITNMIALQHFKPAPFDNIFNYATKKYYLEEVLPYFYSHPDFFDYLYKDTNSKILSKQNNRYFTNAFITNYQKRTTTISFNYSAKDDTEIVLPLMNYPGYIATNQTGDTVKINENANHMMIILLPKGNGQINIHYKGLCAFKIADYLSLISLLLFLICIIRIHKHNNWNKLF